MDKSEIQLINSSITDVFDNENPAVQKAAEEIYVILTNVMYKVPE